MRAIRRIVLVIIAVILLVVLLIFVVEPLAWRRLVRSESIRSLRSATTTNDLYKAVGGLGIFIPLKDGSWIAIRYKDTHGGRIESLAIARDSGGGWYESDYHFCGTFRVYQQERRREEAVRAELSKLGETTTNTVQRGLPESFVALDAIQSASTLQEAREQLLKLGMHPLRE